VAAWCEQRTGDEIVDRLCNAGVPVGKVMQPHRQTELPQLAFRGFFEEVSHPVNAPTKHSTLPLKLSRGPDRVHARFAPLLGEHNRELLSELGLNDDEIAELEAAGVIGYSPAVHGASKAKA
jgi:crotonobetainyl-CoA:carnitine CoA-transferase CaiB-like acyl-CoA transferase